MPPQALVPLPGWAEARSPAELAVRAGAWELRASLVADGTARLLWIEPGAPAPRSFAVIAEPELPADARCAPCGDEVVLEGGGLSIAIGRDGRVRVTDASGRTLLEDGSGGGFFAGPGARRRIRRRIEPGERFYGFGEKTGPLDKRGRRMVFRTADPFDDDWGGWGPDADPMYVDIPFFVGLRGTLAYGLFTDNAHCVTMDVGAADPDVFALEADGGAIDQYLFAGPTIGEVLRRFTRLTGRMPLPPRWTLGYHQARWGYFPDSQVEGICRELRARRLPADGIWLDIQHLDGFRTFTWDPTGFPDPAGLVRTLGASGFKTVVIADPGLKVDPGWDIYRAARDGDHLVRDAKGAVFVGEVWPGGTAFPDFTRPQTRDFWASLVPRTTDLGVRGIWLDMNEPATLDKAAGRTVPDSLAAHGEGTPTTFAEARSVYALGQARATFDGMRRAVPRRRPFLLTRAGFAGIQRHAAVWTGDVPSSWDCFAQTLPMLLGLGLSGVPFVGSDVGGFSGKATAELFARWMQLGAASPFLRGHASTFGQMQEPWRFGAEVEGICRAVLEERMRLLPYLYSLFRQASETGAPILRPLVFEFQDEPACHAIGDQAMLGTFLLVAPVMEEGARVRRFWLPPGRWLDYDADRVHEGPAWLEWTVSLRSMPALLREGAILPRGPVMQWTDERPLAPLFLDLFASDRPSSFALYEDDGDSTDFEEGLWSRTSYGLERRGGEVRLTASAREGRFVPPARPLVVRVRGEPMAAALLDGERLPVRSRYGELVAAGGLWLDGPSAVAVFRDRAPFELAFQSS